MSRLPMVAARPEDPRLAAVMSELRARRGAEFGLPSLYRILAIAPSMFRAWVDFAWPLRLEATTPRALRELMILRGAQVCNARYEWAHHVPMALESGVDSRRIAALHRWRQTDAFDLRERAVLRVAEEVSEGPGASAEAIEALKVAGLPDEEIVEIVLTASFYVCVARFLASMDVPLEEGYEKYLENGECRLPDSLRKP